MNIIKFAGQFAAALVASIVALFAISFGVDMLYPTHSTANDVAGTKVAKQVAKAPAASEMTQAEVAAAAAPKPATPVKVADATAAAKPAKKIRHPGRKVYLRKGACAACHGRKGQRAISYYPAIAGQDKKYMIQQIKDIMKGKRKGGIDKATGHPRAEAMRGALVSPDGAFRITDKEIVQMADWMKDLPPAKPKTPETPIPVENIAAGKKLFKKCVSCHGKAGKKPLKGYPFVAGQKREYVFSQLIDIRDNVRTNGKSKLMLPFVKKLSNEQIAMIADYLSTIDRSKK